MVKVLSIIALALVILAIGSLVTMAFWSGNIVIESELVCALSAFLATAFICTLIIGFLKRAQHNG